MMKKDAHAVMLIALIFTFLDIYIYIYINFHCASFRSHTENMLPSTHPDISKNKIHLVKLKGGLAVLQVHAS